MKISGIYKIQSISHPERIYIGSALHLVNRESAVGKPKSKEHVDSMTIAQRERRLKEKQSKSLINI
jgi:hypothetical protein